MNTATIIRCPRFDVAARVEAAEGQTIRAHKQWLGVWQRLELSDLYYFPIWEEELHDLLQKHFQELTLIFLAYSRSVLGSDSAEDATEMEMAEFYDFVCECHLETKQVTFDQMTNEFIKANAYNNAQAREAHHDVRRSAGTKRDAKAAEVARVKGTNDGTEEAVKDQRSSCCTSSSACSCASPSSAPTRRLATLATSGRSCTCPSCLETMLETEVLPRARKDTSARLPADGDGGAVGAGGLRPSTSRCSRRTTTRVHAERRRVL